MICTLTKNQLTKLTNGFLTLWLSWGLFHVVSSGISHQSRGLSKIEWIVFDKHMGVIYIYIVILYIIIPNSRACWVSISRAGAGSQGLAAFKIRNGTLEPWNPGTLHTWNPGTLEP